MQDAYLIEGLGPDSTSPKARDSGPARVQRPDRAQVRLEPVSLETGCPGITRPASSGPWSRRWTCVRTTTRSRHAGAIPGVRRSTPRCWWRCGCTPPPKGSATDATPKNCSSGQRQADAGLIKAGDPSLKCVLIQAAQRLRLHDPRWRGLYERLRDNGKPVCLAIAAVANRWVRSLHHQLKEVAAA